VVSAGRIAIGLTLREMGLSPQRELGLFTSLEQGSSSLLVGFVAGLQQCIHLS